MNAAVWKLTKRAMIPVAVYLWLVAPAFAQTRTGGGQSSGFGSTAGGGFANRSINSTSSSSGVFGSGRSNSGANSTSLGSGLLDQAGLDSGNFGIDSVQGQGGFFANRQSGGGLNAGMQGGNTRMGGGGGGGNFGGLENLFGNLGNQFQGGNNGGNQRSRLTYRIKPVVAFSVPRQTAEASIPKFTKTVEQMSAKRTLGMSLAAGSKVTATAQGNKVTLSGTVASARDKALLERLVKLEPGVREVENRLTVQPPAADGQ